MFIKYLNIYIIIIISVSEEHTISVYDGKTNKGKIRSNILRLFSPLFLSSLLSI